MTSYAEGKVYTAYADEKLNHHEQTIIVRPIDGGSVIRILGNWMPDGFLDPEKMNGFPYDGFWCDTEGEIKFNGSEYTSVVIPGLAFVFGKSLVRTRGFYSCSPRTGFGEGVHELR
ncbi:MAG: hypothetical protein FJ164_03325 [Gammaproteobacteria bacterium]|nr:hypothetical protein [Gammaproteobacteria bacterium]